MNLLSHRARRAVLSFFAILAVSAGLLAEAWAAKPVPLSCQLQASAAPDLTSDPACDAQICTAVGGTVTYTGTASGGTPPYRYLWELPGGDPFESSANPVTSVYSTAGAYAATLTVTDDRGKLCSDSRSVRIIGDGNTAKSINSTSANALTAGDPVPEQPLARVDGFQLVVANDLGMHCADLDHRVASILPPFNVLHAQVIRKGTGVTPETLPRILDDTNVDVVYSAASNSKDPVLGRTPGPVEPVFKTNFWDINPATGNPVGFDAYDPLYPVGVLAQFPFVVDLGLPVPDLAELYLGGGTLVAAQQAMPGINNPYAVNAPQHFDRFDGELPFFVNFPFGSVISVNWFVADGMPIAATDDQGRENPYPLLRVQAIDRTGALTGVRGAILASTDTVVPVAFETDCRNCHTDSADGGNGAAASLDFGGSPRSGTLFTVAASIDDPDPASPTAVTLEYAADINILRLHDAKHGTSLITGTTLDEPAGAIAFKPVACATCHYSPALDLAQVGPSDDNGKQQTRHQSMSRVMHSFHGQFTDLFPLLPGPRDADPQTRLTLLEQNCYQCHPGKRTQCLRGAMFNGGMLCQDCHGNLAQVGNDFSRDVSPDNPGAFILTGELRVPWADEPKCQSCHTGDAVTNLARQPNVLAAGDGIRLIQAYYTDDPDATPIAAVNQRFAEDQRLYRLSKGHGGVFCEACHGSTHAIWPVTPRSGPYVANDNATATQLQGHDGKIQECDVCHQRGQDGNLTMPLGLAGPHGMHPVNDNRWNHEHRNFTGGQYANCRTCHGQDLRGTVLSVASAQRVLDTKFKDQPQKTFPAGHRFGCGDCHKQK